MMGFRNLTPARRRIWTVLGGIVIGGSVVKFAYFKYVQDLFAMQIQENNMKAVSHLQKTRQFGEWAKNDRESKIPKLNDEQKEQLRRYLSLRSKKRPDLYPSDH